MTTATQTETTIATRGTYTVTFDSAAVARDEMAYAVRDADGDDLEWYETEAEAIADAEERVADDAEEARQDRLYEARNEIAELMEECDDEDLLERIKALLK